jgi:hypothetical protein
MSLSNWDFPDVYKHFLPAPKNKTPVPSSISNAIFAVYIRFYSPF